MPAADNRRAPGSTPMPQHEQLGRSLLEQQQSPPPQAATPSPATRSVAPLIAGGIRGDSKGCFFSCKKHPSCRCAAIHPPKIRFYGKGVPRFAKRGQRRCLWNPQPLQRLAKLLHKPAAAGKKINVSHAPVLHNFATNPRFCPIGRGGKKKNDKLQIFRYNVWVFGE